MRMKICTRCRHNKKVSDFRMKLDKSGKRYPNTTCRKCDSELQSEYYWSKLKNDPEAVKKNRERAEKYRKDHWPMVQAKMKLKRQTKKYKKYVKDYYQKNKQRILPQHRAVCKKYNDRQRKDITEQYILQILSHPREGLKREIVKQHPEFIQLYQSQIKIKRLCKSLQTSNS